MIVFKAHPKPVYGLVFSPDGRSLLTSGGDETVRLWTLNGVDQLREWPGCMFTAPVVFSPDGNFIVRGGHGVRAWLIDGQTNPALRFDEQAESVAFSPDGMLLVAAGRGIRRWEFLTGKLLPGVWGGTRESSGGKQFPAGAVAYSPGGTILATSFGVLGKRAYDSVIYLWQAQSGELLGSLHTDYFSAHPTVIRFSPDGSLLAGIYGPVLRVWDVEARKEQATRSVGKKHFKGLAFTPDGQRLATVSNDATVRLWDTSTWSEVGGFEWKIGKLGAVDVSADGCRMAAGGSTGKVVIWDVD